MAKRSSSEFSARWTLPDKPVIALVSGGLDSMLLAEVLHEHGCLAGVYHANYGLRGADSDADAAGVEAWAREHGVPFRADRFPSLPKRPIYKPLRANSAIPEPEPGPIKKAWNPWLRPTTRTTL